MPRRASESLIAKTGYPHPTSPASTAVMRGNRRVHTRPEMAVRRAIHAAGLRYRVDHALVVGDLRVRPDIVFTRRKLAVFIDGCFWHGCPVHGVRPRANSSYWTAKLARNRARDDRVTTRLQAAGWRVIRVWEHEDPLRAAARIESALRRGA
jgi:DNA mismatch endonuclease (patch repair protein)